MSSRRQASSWLIMLGALIALISTISVAAAAAPAAPRATAAAASASSSQPPRASKYTLYTANLPGGCAVTLVTLNGMHAPAATCLQASSAKASPNTAITSCYNSYVSLTIRGDQGTVCFKGTGYVGFHITHATYLCSSNWSGSCRFGPGYNGWLKMYPSGTQKGFFFNYKAGEVVSGWWTPFGGQNDLTQICNGC